MPLNNVSTTSEQSESSATIDFENLHTRPIVQDDGHITLQLDALTTQNLSEHYQAKAHTPSKVNTTSSSEEDQECAPKSFPLSLNIVIQIVGSRGDVQPFIGLGQELQKHGHRVRLATHDIFDQYVRDAGLEFYPVGGDPAELMSYMVRNPGLIPSMESLRAGDIKKKRIMVKEMLNGFWNSCLEPDPKSCIPFVADAIIANPPSFAHVHCAQALSIPVHMVFTMPWTATGAFAHPLVNVSLEQKSDMDTKTANFISYTAVDFLTWQGLGDIINEWREGLNLEHVAFSEGPNLLTTLNVPFTYCWSPSLVPKPTDWGANINVSGFFFREPSPYTAPAALQEFLSSGPPPLYIGFGSIVIEDPKSLSEMILEAVKITGVRALISRGWSHLDGPESRDVMFLGDCPHEWLFPQVQAVIHHGGAGTTACGLLNGKPTVIIPFFGDQPFWGQMVAEANAGPDPIPYKSVTVSKLVDAIQFCQRQDASEAAKNISASMKSESGVQTAVSFFHASLPKNMPQCDIITGQPAAWTYSANGVKLKLSKTAASILSEHLMIDPKRLKRHLLHPLIIETRRWDPISGTVAAAWGVSTDIAKAARDSVVQPVKTFQKRERNKKTRIVRDGEVETHSASHQSLPERRTQPRAGDHNSTAKAMTVVSANSLGQVAMKISSGLVIIPFAFTEGFRNIPALYGEQPKDYGHIHDWKSGISVAGKSVVLGIYDGLTDVVMLPYIGAKKQGVTGIGKGICKGVIGLSTNLFAATIGVGVYPLQGVYKSVLQAAGSRTSKSIDESLRTEGQYMASKHSHRTVLETFDALRSERLVTRKKILDPAK